MTAATRVHPLREAIATILPGPAETLLLRACLDPGDAGRRALAAWLAGTPDPPAAFARSPLKWMLPLVLRATRHHGIRTDRAFATVVRTATLREQLRTPSYRAIRDQALRALAVAGVRTIVLKGAAWCDLLYPDPSLRHTHDVELLVHDHDWNRLEAALAALPFAGGAAWRDCIRAELTHTSGLPLVLHRKLFRIPFLNLSGDEIWSRSEAVRLGDTPAHVLAPADAFVHACGDAPHAPGSASFRWLVDAWYLLDRRDDLDWDVAIEVAAARGVTLSVSAALDYLVDALDAPVPASVRARLARCAWDGSAIGHQVALHGALAAAGGLGPLVRRTPTLRGKAAILRHRLIPSLAFLSWSTQPQSAFLRATHAQAFRFARGMARRVATKPVEAKVRAKQPSQS